MDISLLRVGVYRYLKASASGLDPEGEADTGFRFHSAWHGLMTDTTLIRSAPEDGQQDPREDTGFPIRYPE
jgi:hypothetical protein